MINKAVIQCAYTPLASIFGSGFLVIISVLANTLGALSIYGMIGICLLAFCVGEIIRHNIEHVEPLLESKSTPKSIWFLEKCSDFCLVPAYVISVTLYLKILSSYALHVLGADNPFAITHLTNGIILFILFIGLSKGLKVLEGLEKKALLTTFAIIFLIITAFLIKDVTIFSTNSYMTPPVTKLSTWELVTMLAGTLIVVQGFETTRYMGQEFNSGIRVKASRFSQILSSMIYIAFVAVSLPLMHILNGNAADNGLLTLCIAVAAWLSMPLVVAAVFSQFSAAIADTIAASGNLNELSKGYVTEKIAYILIAVAAIYLSFKADTMQILALASQAFALYYLIQCLIALLIVKGWKKLILLALAVILVFITLFATPIG